MGYGSPEVSLEMLVALGRIPDRLREIVIDRVVVGMTLAAIAERENVSRTRVQQLERNGLRDLAIQLRRLGVDG